MHDKYLALPGETRADYTKRIYEMMEQEKVHQYQQMISGEVQTIIEVDDFGFLLPGFDDVLRLKESFPNFKMTAFTIPFPHQFFGANSKMFKKEKYKQWAKIVNSYEWLEIAIHGFYHLPFEFDCSYQKAETAIKAWENLFEEIGLKYSKIFRAPYWQYSYDALMALKDAGYTVAIDRNHPRPVPEGLKTYMYNWSFEEAMPVADFIKGHGHFVGKNKNNIKECLANMLNQIPPDAKFITLGDYLKINPTEKNESN